MESRDLFDIQDIYLVTIPMFYECIRMVSFI